MNDMGREDLNEILDNNWGADIEEVSEEDLFAVYGTIGEYLNKK